MIELQIINKVLEDGSLAFLLDNGIKEDYFTIYSTEYAFIIEHYKKFNKVPDKLTFLDKFNEFDLVECNESSKYLVETINEQYLYSRLVPFVHKVAELTKVDANEAVEFIRSNIDNLTRLQQDYREAYDIVKNTADRKSDAKFRQEAEGLLGVTTGIDELDKITHGWLKEDFIVILGRTNEGKTWVMLFFLVAAWQAGVPVLLYSGEMSETLVGYRFDTLNAHFKNSAIMGGGAYFGSDREPKTADQYYKYLDNLSTSETPFYVVTPKHIGGKRLTISVLHSLIEKYKPGIVGIDQLSLMDDERSSKGQNERISYTHISEDLYLTSEKYQLPILSPAQANREAAKKKDEDKSPELTEIAESDGVGQNASRVISIKKIDTTLKISLKKNRYGKNNQDLLVLWDIDNGYIKPFLSADNRSTTSSEGSIIENNFAPQTSISEGVDLF